MVMREADLDERLRDVLHAAVDDWQPAVPRSLAELHARRRERADGVANRAVAAVVSCFPSLTLKRVGVAGPASLAVVPRVAVFNPAVGTLPSQSATRASLLGFMP